ncbi:nagb/rpia/CoA transferase-like protein [Myriangium duriaei CBS 260.36]|uniref:Translation initiation factor eIF2B subunit beta n=1 Tax=Myriangium duriaei CBS 260.36 TaxID=1168546 RepID=A0A9P4J619_9PEZI|nr:nagb/rpia/CoA transferase-like protein [Myriangium duriaei CBS 260.36]
MPSNPVQGAPSLASFLKNLKQTEVERSIETFISLVKRRQIRNSRPCAIATAQLLLKVVGVARVKDAGALIERVRKVGQRLVAAHPREMAVGNIVRRVLGLIREVVEDGADSNAADYSDEGQPEHSGSAKKDSFQRPGLSSHISTFSPLHHGIAVPNDKPLTQQTRATSSHSPSGWDRNTDMLVRPPMLTATTSPQVTSLFGLLSTPEQGSPSQTPPIGSQSPVIKPGHFSKVASAAENKVDVKAEVIDGIKELIDELEVVDDQIAAYALDHIHSNEIILTHTSSQTIQRFLLTAARKRKFTVVFVEAYPNDHESTHDTIMRGHKKAEGDEEGGDDRWKALTAMGITVIVIPDSAIFALMSRVNKVVLAPHSVLANGSLIAAAGAQIIAQAAKVHQIPVVVLSGVYKLSPVYPFDTEDLIEYGDPGKVVGFEEGALVSNVDVINPIFDYVPAELVDLYITNLGGHAPSYLYRIVADHYRVEDINLS